MKIKGNTISIHQESLPIKGGTMEGTVNMNNHPLEGIPEPVKDDQATNRKFVEDSVKNVKEIANRKTEKVSIQVTLKADSWVDNKQSVSAKGVTADNDVFITAAPDSYVAYAESMIYCSAQEKDLLTFACGEVPTTQVNVNVIIFT